MKETAEVNGNLLSLIVRVIERAGLAAIAGVLLYLIGWKMPDYSDRRDEKIVKAIEGTMTRLDQTHQIVVSNQAKIIELLNRMEARTK